MKNVNMREIGRTMGVSAVTISKALSGKPGVSDALRQKIIQKAADMGYQYSAVRSIGPEQRDVGILVPERFMDPGTSFYASLCKKLVQQLAERHCCGLLEILNDASEQRHDYPSLLRSERVGGLVILGQVTRDYMTMLEQAGVTVPYMCLDFYDERSTADSVVSDGMYGAYRLTSHLIHMGHRRIGFLGSILATSSIMDRYLGYYRSMLLHDLPIGEGWVIPDRDARGDLLPFPLPKDDLTAVVCNCDRVAAELISQLQKKGYRVPADLSVVGFDHYYAYPCEPALTTYAVDQDTMARTAAEMIVHRMQGIPNSSGRIVTSGRLVYGKSVLNLCAEQGVSAAPRTK